MRSIIEDIGTRPELAQPWYRGHAPREPEAQPVRQQRGEGCAFVGGATARLRQQLVREVDGRAHAAKQAMRCSVLHQPSTLRRELIDPHPELVAKPAQIRPGGARASRSVRTVLDPA
jgi:hypothetical protein